MRAASMADGDSLPEQTSDLDQDTNAIDGDGEDEEVNADRWCPWELIGKTAAAAMA